MNYDASYIMVEKNIPIPKSKQGIHKSKKVPCRNLSLIFEDMEIGDSFALPLEKPRDYYNFYQSVNDTAKRNKIKFTCRNLGTEIRFWKVADL